MDLNFTHFMGSCNFRGAKIALECLKKSPSTAFHQSISVCTLKDGLFMCGIRVTFPLAT